MWRGEWQSLIWEIFYIGRAADGQNLGQVRLLPLANQSRT
jgi:hypothetical protein